MSQQGFDVTRSSNTRGVIDHRNCGGKEDCHKVCISNRANCACSSARPLPISTQIQSRAWENTAGGRSATLSMRYQCQGIAEWVHGAATREKLSACRRVGEMHGRWQSGDGGGWGMASAKLRRSHFSVSTRYPFQSGGAALRVPCPTPSSSMTRSRVQVGPSEGRTRCASNSMARARGQSPDR